VTTRICNLVLADIEFGKENEAMLNECFKLSSNEVGLETSYIIGTAMLHATAEMDCVDYKKMYLSPRFHAENFVIDISITKQFWMPLVLSYNGHLINALYKLVFEESDILGVDKKQWAKMFKRSMEKDCTGCKKC
jgi:hypothetical protein